MFVRANLTDAKLKGATMRGTDFSGATMLRADLSEGIIIGTKFCGANLRSALFCKATIEKADFSGADLTGADFTGASQNLMYYDGETIFEGVKGLDRSQLIEKDLAEVVSLQASLMRQSAHRDHQPHAGAGLG